jgi:hypothetical protein
MGGQRRTACLPALLHIAWTMQDLLGLTDNQWGVTSEPASSTSRHAAPVPARAPTRSSNASSSSGSGNAVRSAQVSAGGGRGKGPVGNTARREHRPQQEGPQGFQSTRPAQEQPSRDAFCIALDLQYLVVGMFTSLSRALRLHTEWCGPYPTGTHQLVGDPNCCLSCACCLTNR